MGEEFETGATPRIVLVTHPSEGAGAFARQLVERRLVACVNLLPVRSVYRWQGQVEAEEEVLMVLKTREDRLDSLRRFVASSHPYEVPEFLVLEVAGITDAYRDWLLMNARAPESMP
ncbi:MAG TPA: divalent-cation tolerance protein CutA [Planctomycetes bacterium]|nr:divalent-cation tolerance protein CutA [Planctomycetota bacterium]